MFLDKDYVFILYEDKVTDIITIADLTKSSARAYVFMLVSSFETKMTEIIRRKFKEEDMSEILTEDRINKAMETYEKRTRRNTDIDIYDCLELSDKKKLFINAVDLTSIGFNSKSKFNDFYNILELIRNDISHANDYIGDNKYKVINCLLQVKEMLNREIQFI